MVRYTVDAGFALLRSLGERFATIVRTIAANREQVSVVSLLWLVGFVGTLVAFQVALRDVVWRDLHAMLPLWIHDLMAVIAVSPARLLVIQMKTGVVVGLLVAAPGVLYYGRNWLRGRDRWPENGVSTGDTLLVGLGCVALFAAGVGMAYVAMVPALVEALTGPTGSASVVPYLVYWWFRLVLVLCLSAGIAATCPFLAWTGVRACVVARHTLVRDGIWAALAVVSLGLVLWPLDPVVQIAWSGPLLASLALSVGVVRIRSGGPRGGAPGAGVDPRTN